MTPDRRVLVVAEYGILNGGERSFLAVIPHLSRLGWDFVVVLPTDSEFELALQKLGIKTLPLAKQDMLGKRLTQELMRQQLARHIQSVRPALVHCNSLSTSRLCGPVTSKMGIPGLGYMRDMMKLSRQAIADINQLNLIIAVSQATRDWHVEQGVSPTKTAVIYNGVDLERFFPLDRRSTDRLQDSLIRQEFGISSCDPILLFVGQIGMRKGVDLLVTAFEKITAANSDVHLLVIGERNSQKHEAIEFENLVQRQVQDSAAARRVHWLGRRDDVAAIMREATILIHPARQEPLGRVLLESAASGLPIITTAVGGSAEILQSLQEFELLQDVDADKLARRTSALLANQEERQLVSKRLRIVAESHFSEKICAEKLHQEYNRLLTYVVGN